MTLHASMGWETSLPITDNDANAEKLPTVPLHVAVVQGSVSLTDQFLSELERQNISLLRHSSPDKILRRLELSSERWDIVLYPIWTNFQPALNFARDARRIREQHGAPPYPRVLVLSFVEHSPASVNCFRRTQGTVYSRFTSGDNLVHLLHDIREQMTQAQRASRLHLRFVHSGNPSGLGCIPGEHLFAAYGSFFPGEEQQLTEQKSVLRFINLLATNRWRFRSALELVDLMIRHPLYQRENGSADVLSFGSVKSYIGRTENVLSALWYRSKGIGAPPRVIVKESRGKKEVAYRLLCTAEFEHI